MQTINENSKFTCKICFEEYQCISSISNYNAYKYYGCCKDCIISSIKFNGSQPIDVTIGYNELLSICDNIDEFIDLTNLIMQKTIQTDPILKEIMEKRNDKQPCLTPEKLIAILYHIYTDLYQSSAGNEIIITPYQNTSLSTQIRENADELVNHTKEAIVSTLFECYSFVDFRDWIYTIKCICKTMENYIAFGGFDLVKRIVNELVSDYHVDLNTNEFEMDIIEADLMSRFEDMTFTIKKFIDAKDKANEDRFINEVETTFKEYSRKIEIYCLQRFTKLGELYVKKMKGDRSNIGKCECKNGVINKTSHKCTSCNQVSCDKCLRIISDGQEHECSKEDLELVAYYHSHCKNCPKCGTWIEKASGCNDMFCTECHTLFDFVSGNQKYGNLHNPERMEYLNRIGQQDNSFNYTLSEITDHISIIKKINNDTFNDQTITNFIELAGKIMGTIDRKVTQVYNIYQVPKADDSFSALFEICNYANLHGFHQVDSSQETPLDTTLVKQYSFFMIDSDEKIVKALYGMSYIWNYEEERRKAMSIIGPKICALSQMLLQSTYDINQIKEFIMNTCKEIDEKVGGPHIKNSAVMLIN